MGGARHPARTAEGRPRHRSAAAGQAGASRGRAGWAGGGAHPPTPTVRKQYGETLHAAVLHVGVHAEHPGLQAQSEDSREVACKRAWVA